MLLGRFCERDAGQKQDTSEQVSDGLLHPECATSVLRACYSPELTKLIEAWPTLTQNVRDAILRIVRDNTPQPLDRRE